MSSPIVFILLWLAISVLCLPVTLRFLVAHGVVGLNYKNERIPIGLGLFIWLCALFYFFLLEMWQQLNGELPEWLTTANLTYFFMLTVVFIVGWLDDTIGETRVKGLRGHFLQFYREGVVSTGLVKAGMIALLAFWSAMELATTFLDGLLAFGVLLLTTNGLNLFDLRPGRALKVFLLLTILLLAFTALQATAVLAYVFPLVIGALLTFQLDLKAKAMLGDMGANMLGFSLGYLACLVLPNWGLAVWILIAGSIQSFAERRSLTKAIANNRVLAWFDELGR